LIFNTQLSHGQKQPAASGAGARPAHKHYSVSPLATHHGHHHERAFANYLASLVDDYLCSLASGRLSVRPNEVAFSLLLDPDSTASIVGPLPRFDEDLQVD
jgi:hypothetical protein